MARKRLPLDNPKQRNSNGLTTLEQSFCEEYLRWGSAKKACEAVGYSPATSEKKGRELYSRERVQEYLQEMANMMESPKIASATEIQERLTSIMRGEAEIEDHANTFVEKGIQKDVKFVRKPNGKEILDATVNLAKIKGMFNKDINLTVKPVVIKDDI